MSAMNTPFSNASISTSSIVAKSPLRSAVVLAAGEAVAEVVERAKIPPPPELPAEVAAVVPAVGSVGAAGAIVESKEASSPADADVIPEPFAPVSPAEAMSMALSPPQRLAIQMLTSGRTLVAAATAAGVNRTTLYRWLKGDPAFQAAYNAWQKDMRDTARGRILALSDLAINTVARAMTQGDTRAALRILQATGALNIDEPGSTDPTELRRLQELERTRTNSALRKAEARAAMEAELPL
jgi:transposase-like protein